MDGMVEQFQPAQFLITVILQQLLTKPIQPECLGLITIIQQQATLILTMPSTFKPMEISLFMKMEVTKVLLAHTQVEILLKWPLKIMLLLIISIAT